LKQIDLNVDIAEGFPHDAELLKFATSANICCGVHAGSAQLTADTVELCRSKGVRIGAHPGYPDRGSMGRAPLSVEHQRDWLGSVLQQICDFCVEYPTQYVKPHGALYNETAQPISVGWDSMAKYPSSTSPYEAGGYALSLVPGTGMLIMALRINKVPIMGLPGTMHLPIGERAHVAFIKEGFADRAYLENGLLMPRSEPGAVLTNRIKIAAQVIRLANECDSICLHGDTPDCLEFAELIYKTLVDEGFEVKA
jgi:UPF0271 protein